MPLRRRARDRRQLGHRGSVTAAGGSSQEIRVRLRVDFALQDLRGAGDGELGDLVAQRFLARTTSCSISSLPRR
jgi:hypothetical protein